MRERILTVGSKKLTIDIYIRRALVPVVGVLLLSSKGMNSNNPTSEISI